jgi:predicted metal-dependent enzyme (double-stranded beta helix superfamily)
VNALEIFVADFEALLETQPTEDQLLQRGEVLLGTLIKKDDWLDASFAVPDADRYRQYLLHLDSDQRFSVVSFVWGPGQQTPVHDHTVWGLIGMLRGAEVEQHYVRAADGTLGPDGDVQRLEVGQVDKVSPKLGDLHRVSNAYSDQTSISIHVYGGDIGAIERSTYKDGTSSRFVSGYTNAPGGTAS